MVAALCEGHRALVLGRRRGLVLTVELSSPPLGSGARCVVGDSQLLSAASWLRRGWVSSCPCCCGLGGSSRGRKQQDRCVVCTPLAPAWLCHCDCCPSLSWHRCLSSPASCNPSSASSRCRSAAGQSSSCLPPASVPSLLGCCWVSLMPKPCLLLTINSRGVPSHSLH